MASVADVLSTGNEQSPFWFEVADLRRSLLPKANRNQHGQPFVYLTSIDDRYRGRVGGVTCEATIEVAAKALAKNAQGGATHNLATQEEIDRFKRDQTARADILAKVADANKSVTIVRVEGSRNNDGSLDLKPIHDKKGESK